MEQQEGGGGGGGGGGDPVWVDESGVGRSQED